MGLWDVEGRANVANNCTHADALLIAAAPDLLIALQLALSASWHDGEQERTFADFWPGRAKVIRAALSKAGSR
jgi:hypothetical protein